MDCSLGIDFTFVDHGDYGAAGIEDPNPFFKWLMGKPFAQNVIWGPHFYAQVGAIYLLLLQYYMTQHGTARHGPARPGTLHFTASHFTTLHHTPGHYTTLASLQCTTSQHRALPRTALHSIAHCTFTAVHSTTCMIPRCRLHLAHSMALQIAHCVGYTAHFTSCCNLTQLSKLHCARLHPLLLPAECHPL